jgi:exopolyphosphatase/guanosine-5'-triphosphate,3'-diphosphate pyrophosphatase
MYSERSVFERAIKGFTYGKRGALGELMDGIVAPAALPASERRPSAQDAAVYAAIDLGTNNCRLLIAAPSGRGFRIVDTYSRIVRLGEGLSQTGRLSDAAMARTLDALSVCADKIVRRGATRVRAVATQACRGAANRQDFLDAVLARTGLTLEIITPEAEAALSVTGCGDLIDPKAEVALILDVGGGSTELSWIDTKARRAGPLKAEAWVSIPVGVVTLAERFPERADQGAWRADMAQAFAAEVRAFTGADHLRPRFLGGRGHTVGTSGAITSLAGVHLGLPRYDRQKVDSLWMTRAECKRAGDRLAAMTLAERTAHPCVGAGRADLVLAGAAILEAVQSLWPSERLRVADRGLREGLLLALMAQDRRA